MGQCGLVKLGFCPFSHGESYFLWVSALNVSRKLKQDSMDVFAFLGGKREFASHTLTVPRTL